MGKLTGPCEEITKKISYSLDNKLSSTDRLFVFMHVISCKFCLRFKKQMISISKMAKLSNANFESRDIDK